MSDRWDGARARLLARGPGALIALLPGALTIYLAFQAGGYFVGPTALVTLALLLVLVVRVLLTSHPGAGISPRAGLALGGLALFALWTLMSQSWSHAPGRALEEFDRALLYLLVLALFASLGGQAWRLRWMVRGMALAIVVVCAIGLTSRLLPEVWPVARDSVGSRLDYPITYGNALGLLAALGVIMCFGLTCSERESRTARVLAAAALPVLGTALLLTLSRGAFAAGVVGLIVFVVVAHPRALLTGIAATVPATAIAMTRTYDAELLFAANPLTQAARDQGEHVAMVVLLCAVGAAAVRALLLVSDRFLGEMRLRPPTRRLLLGTAAVALTTIVVVGAIVVDAREQYERFVDTSPSAVAAPTSNRDRLADVRNQDRAAYWGAALDRFEKDPVRGRGAGTFQLSWQRDRPNQSPERDAHSLYVEVMSELGLVGLGLLAVTLLAILLGLAHRARGPDRALFATILAAGVAWALAAGADWHWELPGVTLWLFALGGTALAQARAGEPGRPILAWLPRFAVAVALCAVMVLVPLPLHGSQNRLQVAIAQLDGGRCDRVMTLARQSLNGVDSRPQAYELLARCALEMDEHKLAIRMITEAIERDPDNWRPRYGLAVARARAGLDPRGPARSALRRNPNEPLAIDAVEQFSAHVGARAWRRASQGLDIQVPQI